MLPKLLPDQQGQLGLDLRQVGAHGPRSVQQDANSPLQDDAEQTAAPCSQDGAVRQGTPGGPSPPSYPRRWSRDSRLGRPVNARPLGGDLCGVCVCRGRHRCPWLCVPAATAEDWAAWMAYPGVSVRGSCTPSPGPQSLRCSPPPATGVPACFTPARPALGCHPDCPQPALLSHPSRRGFFVEKVGAGALFPARAPPSPCSWTSPLVNAILSLSRVSPSGTP